MLILILDSILIVLLFTPFGLILSNENQKNLDYFSTQLLYGLIIISFIALSLNFFLPLNKNLNSLINPKSLSEYKKIAKELVFK